MPFKPGHKKIGGIQKGTKHSRTQVADQIREYLGKDLISAYLETITSQTSPRERREAYATLLPYACPKLQATEMKLDASVELNETDKVKELALEISGLKDELKSYLKEES